MIVHNQKYSFKDTVKFLVDPLRSRLVQVTLNDCLACSGCVTSAETVLLEQHSASELMSALQDSTKRVIVSVSPQSRASLAARHALGPLECWR